MVILSSVRENGPLWRNWQTHLTQNQAVNNRAGSSPASGIRARGIYFVTLALSFYSGNVRAKAFAGKRSICIKMHILLFFMYSSMCRLAV